MHQSTSVHLLCSSLPCTCVGCVARLVSLVQSTARELKRHPNRERSEGVSRSGGGPMLEPTAREQTLETPQSDVGVYETGSALGSRVRYGGKWKNTRCTYLPGPVVSGVVALPRSNCVKRAASRPIQAARVRRARPPSHCDHHACAARNAARRHGAQRGARGCGSSHWCDSDWGGRCVSPVRGAARRRRRIRGASADRGRGGVRGGDAPCGTVRAGCLVLRQPRHHPAWYPSGLCRPQLV